MRNLKSCGRKTGLGCYKNDSEEKNEWEIYKSNEGINRSYQMIDPVQVMQQMVRTRYKLLVVLDEIVEMSPEFYETQKITIHYNFLGLEQKIPLQTSYALHYGSVLPINKIRLCYFFAESISGINQFLRQKDVIDHASRFIES